LAGIAGLASAIALRKAGLEATVFERSPKASEIGAGITLWSNAVGILAEWGVASQLLAQGNIIERGELRDFSGRTLVRTPVAAVGRELGSVSVAVHRAELLRLLYEKTDSNSVLFGKDCVAVEQDSDGVTAHFADGRQRRCQILIGADGIGSLVFRDLHGNIPLRYAGYFCYRGITRYSGTDIPLGQAFENWGPGRRFGVIRLDAERVFWFANVNTHPEALDPDHQVTLSQAFGTCHYPIPALLQQTDKGQILRHPIYDRPIRRDQQGRGRIALVGDAAHPLTPDLGQGACQAIEDAHVLAYCLGSTTASITALRNYERIRWPRIRWISRRSRFQGWVGQHSTGLGCRLRDLLMRLTPESVMLRSYCKLVSFQLDDPLNQSGRPS